MNHVKYILVILVMLLVLILVVQNQEAFSTSLFFRVDLPLLHGELRNVSVYHVVTVAFLFGVVIAGVYGIVERFRLKKEIRSLKKAVKENDAELNSLRNLPITSEEFSPAPVDPNNGAESSELR